MIGDNESKTVGDTLSNDGDASISGGFDKSLEPKRPRDLMDEIRDKLGPKWKKSFKPYECLRRGMTMEKVEAVKAQLRRLVPLSTALRAEGFTQEAEELLYSRKDKNPYKWVFSEFEKALAEGEARAIERLNDPQTSKREQDALKWMLERALEKSTYAPKPTTKTVNENRSVNVTMKLPENKNLKALPTATLEKEPALDAEVVKALPFVKKEKQ